MKATLFIPLLLWCLHTMAQAPARYSVVINEIFADPSPSNGLPSTEFIELYNRSAAVVNLKGWKLSDGSSTAVISSSLLLQPDSFLILCPAAGLTAYSFYGRALSLSNFPSLNNEGDLISLLTSDGTVMHAVSYTPDWYNNTLKAQGGWTLELIDPGLACAGKSSWTASTHAGGGTPGRINASFGTAPAPAPLQLQYAYPADSSTVLLFFSGTADSASASAAGLYSFSPQLFVEKATVTAPLFNRVELHLNNPMQPGIIYTLTAKGLSNCTGLLSNTQVIATGLPVTPVAGSLVINELLFDPKSGGADYVELFNRSGQLLDLSSCYLANRNSSGILYNMERISTDPLLCFAGGYPVISPDTAAILKNFTVAAPAALIQAALPSLPDSDGHLVLVSKTGEVIDEVAYDDQWHHPLIDNKEGVALERIDPSGPSQDAGNWTSAASLAGFGTPTAVNSQFASGFPQAGIVYVDPAVFSPNQDGFQDRAGIYYRNAVSGTTARIRILDARGIPVRTLIPIGTLQQEGVIWWDGTDDQLHPVSTGIYVLLAELFTPKGKVKRYKYAITIANAQ